MAISTQAAEAVPGKAAGRGPAAPGTGRETQSAGRARIRDSRDDTLADVAAYYYEDHLDQEEIAGRLGVSRSTVSRMLSEAAQRGIVEIRIRRPLPLSEALQDRLMTAFDLRDALVLDTRGMGSDTLTKVGRLAARSLDTRLGDGDVLAISWGTAVRAVAKGLDPRTPRHVEVVQLLGGTGSRDLEVDGTELARSLASSLGGQCHYLNAPLVVDDPDLASRLLRQRSIRETLDIGAHADIGVAGIGALVPEVSSLLRSGHLTRSELTALRQTGAVGDVCGHLFTVTGELVDCEFTRRLITISVAGLLRIPRRMGVAVGEAKVAAILGAVRSRMVNVLVTDDVTATAMLKDHP